MTQSELKELEKVVQEFSKNGYLVAAETGAVLNNGKYQTIIRVVVMHEKTGKYFVTMYRNSPREFKQWLTDNIGEMISEVQRQIVEEKPKSNLIIPGL